MSGNIIVLVQIICLWTVLAIMYSWRARQDKSAPVNDVGVFWLAVLVLYATLPPVFWLIQGGNYISIFSGRLLQLQPSSIDVISLLNIAMGYAIGFSITYFFVCYKLKAFTPRSSIVISMPKIIGAVGVVLFVKVFLLFIGLSGIIETPDSYIDTYRVIQEAPLALRQILKFIMNLNAVAIIIILVGILQRWPKYRVLFFVFVFVVMFSFNPNGSRTELATGLLTIAIAWHSFVKPISSKVWIGSAFAGILLFLSLGFLRGITSVGDYDILGQDNPGVGEFDALWANGVELLQEKRTGNLHVPLNARFGEFWEYIPSQLLPFEKTSLSIWYLQTFYPEYKDQGGGWAFGAISQAVIGHGILEALVRGLLIGGFYGGLMRFYRSANAKWWYFPLFLNVMVFSYLSIRDTTFTQIGFILQNLLPNLFMIAILGALVARFKRFSV